MRLLITGGCGFLGHHLVEHFLKAEPRVSRIVVLDKMTYASSGWDRLRDIGEVVNALTDSRMTVLGCDLAQPVPEGIKKEIGEVDYIIHAAAESHVDRSITDPLPFIQSNVLGTHHLLMLSRELQPRRTFLISTDEVYGPSGWDDPGNTEMAPFRPANPYAAAKAGGEMLGFAYANTYKIPITIVNTMNLIGERQHPEKFVPLVIRKILKGETITIHADPTKTRAGTRSYLHCRNFASALSFLIENWYGSIEKGGGRPPMADKVHVAGEREVDNLELAHAIHQATRDFAGGAGFGPGPQRLRTELVDFHSSRPGHDLRYALDDTTIRTLGWTQPRTLAESLVKTVRWYLDNPRWLEWS